MVRCSIEERRPYAGRSARPGNGLPADDEFVETTVLSDDTSATIDVTLAKLDDSYAGPPQDLDGDGLYEDVNGNGEVTLTDIQALFVNRDSAVIEENGELFDFTANGEFNNVDIQKLFPTISENN